MHTGGDKVKAWQNVRERAMNKHSILEELQLLVTSLQSLISTDEEIRPTLKKKGLEQSCPILLLLPVS